MTPADVKLLIKPVYIGAHTSWGVQLRHPGLCVPFCFAVGAVLSQIAFIMNLNLSLKTFDKKPWDTNKFTEMLQKKKPSKTKQ